MDPQPFGELEEETAKTVNRVYGIGGTDATFVTSVSEGFTLTSNLRWRNGVLEQAWMHIATGRASWRPVPTVSST